MLSRLDTLYIDGIMLDNSGKFSHHLHDVSCALNSISTVLSMTQRDTRGLHLNLILYFSLGNLLFWSKDALCPSHLDTTLSPYINTLHTTFLPISHILPYHYPPHTIFFLIISQSFLPHATFLLIPLSSTYHIIRIIHSSPYNILLIAQSSQYRIPPFTTFLLIP